MKTAIEAKSPKTLKEADNYKESGKAGEVKGEVKGMVIAGQGGLGQGHRDGDRRAAGPVQGRPQGGHPAGQEESPGKPVPIPAAGAVPKPAPAEQVNLEAGKHEANQEMADAEVTDEQLAKSGEPEFQGALADKQKAAEHANTAPAEYRQQEKETIAQGKEEAAARDGGRRHRHAGRQGRCDRQAGGREGQDQVEGRGEARRGHRQGPGASSPPPRPT